MIRARRPGGSAPAGSRYRRVLATTAAVLGLVGGSVLSTGSASAASGPASVIPRTGGALGSDVIVFDPTMSQDSIQSTLNTIADQQVPNQFGTERYALLFKPGTYGSAANPLVFQVGYYTTVAGLGLNPGDTVINGEADVFNQCFDGVQTNCNATDNFWRSLTNLTINVAGQSGCKGNTEMWAASQAAPMRRVVVNGLVSLMDYCDGSPDYASGGFIADSPVQRQHHHQRLAAAVHHAQHQPGRLDERRVEPGVLRRPRRPGAELRLGLRPRRSAAVHDAGHVPGDQGGAVPVRGRRRQVPGLRPVRAEGLQRSDLGRRRDRRASPCRWTRSTS